MALKLYLHPLASYCHKVLIALYESATPFEPLIVDLGDAAERAALVALWPFGKFPLLSDERRGCTVPESSIIIEYLDRHYPGAARLIPDEPAAALETRLQDRFYDLYVHAPMQKIVLDRLRPAGEGDATGVAEARQTLTTAYALADAQMATRRWAAGADFSMADCAAAPALFYADKLQPFRGTHPHLAAYFERLLQRPSYARVLHEAEPWMRQFPG